MAGGMIGTPPSWTHTGLDYYNNVYYAGSSTNMPIEAELSGIQVIGIREITSNTCIKIRRRTAENNNFETITFNSITELTPVHIELIDSDHTWSRWNALRTVEVTRPP